MRSEESMAEELFSDDEPDEGGEVAVMPLAHDAFTPIPALRELSAQALRIGPDGNAQPVGPSEDGEGEIVVVLEDPEGLAPKPAALSMFAYALAALFDGQRTAQDVSDDFAEKYKQVVPCEQILDLQRDLDKGLFLLSRRFERVLKQQLQSYLQQEDRVPAHAGSAYPAEPEALEKTVTAFFTGPDAPGSIPAPGTSDTLRALMLPHIDLRVGGSTYAHGYAELLKQSQADLFFILGVAHEAPGEGLYFVSEKNFSTPKGVVRTAREVARQLQQASGLDRSISELAHRTEHSIEFQAVLLQTLLGPHRSFEIVPVLCGSIEPFLLGDSNPLQADSFRRFIDALRVALDKSGRRACMVCSVDLSHVGPEFGHSAMMTEKLLPAVERGDRRWLEAVSRLDSRAVFAEIERTQNSRHIDAVMSVLTMLETLKGRLKSGRLLHYDQLLKQGTHSAVSYASMAFE